MWHVMEARTQNASKKGTAAESYVKYTTKTRQLYKHPTKNKQKQTNSVALSPRANYTD
jgi:hypothetical protein